MKNERFINPDRLHTPCYHPLRKVWSVKIGYRKFEFKSLDNAQKFHLEYCLETSVIPKKHKNEVRCSDRPPIPTECVDRQIKVDIAMLLGDGVKRKKWVK